MTDHSVGLSKLYIQPLNTYEYLIRDQHRYVTNKFFFLGAGIIQSDIYMIPNSINDFPSQQVYTINNISNLYKNVTEMDEVNVIFFQIGRHRHNASISKMVVKNNHIQNGVCIVKHFTFQFLIVNDGSCFNFNLHKKQQIYNTFTIFSGLLIRCCCCFLLPIKFPNSKYIKIEQ